MLERAGRADHAPVTPDGHGDERGHDHGDHGDGDGDQWLVGNVAQESIMIYPLTIPEAFHLMMDFHGALSSLRRVGASCTRAAERCGFRPTVRSYSKAEICNNATARLWRFSIRPPMEVSMPPLASADPKMMSLQHLLKHGREATQRWRIQHPAFWRAFFERLGELKGQVNVPEAIQVLQISAKLRLVDLELVNASVETLLTAEDEDFLDLPQKDLAEAVEALAVIRPEAMDVALRVLATRAHRLRATQFSKVLSLAAQAKSSELHTLADAFCRALVERQDASSQDLTLAAETTAQLVPKGLYRLEPSPCGLELLFQHAARRVQSFTRLQRLVAAAEISGKTQALQRLQQRLEEDSSVISATAAKKGNFGDRPRFPAKSLGNQRAEELKVLELFAGIGGWRLALSAAAASGLAVTAYDSGPHCSEVYRMNFGERCSRRNIEQLSLKDLDGFDVWLMSPPCQPFSTTREAKQRDLQDKRCAALEHLTKLLPQLQQPPRWIALENVKGFYDSEACLQWKAALSASGFRAREIILDLISFGTPNHRTRYYLLAERDTRNLELLAPAPEPRSEKEHLPPGFLISGPWAEKRRASLNQAHAAARQSPKQKEEIFLRERADFLRDVQEASGLPLAGDLQLAGTSKWKLLPLPRARSDTLLLCFEDMFRVTGEALDDLLGTVKRMKGTRVQPWLVLKSLNEEFIDKQET
eukprot:s1323_g8.t2